MTERIRVLVVDDSALMRKLIPAILARDSSIEVVGTAMDGAFALKKIEELQPDVVTLDLEMPRMDGMETLRLIMGRAPLPVILFSTHSKEGGYATLKALALGAVDFVAKPKNAAAGRLEEIADQLIAKIKVAKRAAGRKLRRSASQEKGKPRAASSAPRHCHRNFHRRAECAAICFAANSCGFSIHHRDRAAHARRIHRNVCEAPR
jgi:two-component system, chemotaxis family, protein-glutamate methylesterase/glutaminase